MNLNIHDIGSTPGRLCTTDFRYLSVCLFWTDTQRCPWQSRILHRSRCLLARQSLNSLVMSNRACRNRSDAYLIKLYALALLASFKYQIEKSDLQLYVAKRSDVERINQNTQWLLQSAQYVNDSLPEIPWIISRLSVGIIQVSVSPVTSQPIPARGICHRPGRNWRTGFDPIDDLGFNAGYRANGDLPQDCSPISRNASP